MHFLNTYSDLPLPGVWICLSLHIRFSMAETTSYIYLYDWSVQPGTLAIEGDQTFNVERMKEQTRNLSK